MGTVTKQYTEDAGASYKSTWTFIYTLSDTLLVGGDSFLIPRPTTTASYVYSGKKYGSALTSFDIYNGSTKLGYYNNAFPAAQNTYYGSWATGVSKTLPVASIDDGTLSAQTSSFFNNTNPTQRVVNLTYKVTSVGGFSSVNTTGNTENSFYFENWNDWDAGLFNLTTLGITLNAPPTFTSSQVSLTSVNGTAYAGITTANVSVSALSAKYGGTISSVALAIGNENVTGTISGTGATLTMPLNTAGTFTPIVTVTDSRGQVTTETLNDITVKPYECSVTHLAPSRINSSTFKLDDEGTNAVLQATFTFSEFSGSTLTAPTVKINGTPTSSVTWYSNWTATDGFSNEISSWSSVASGTIVYAKLTNGTTGFASDSSFIISIIPKTTINTTGGAEMSTVLSQAFYLLVGRPGGHGLGIGMKPPGDALYVDMTSYFQQEAYFKDAVGTLKALFDFIYPIGSYYETSDTNFDPNAIWGGTWILEAEGQVHISAGTNYTIAGASTNTTDGGEATHTLTTTEMPSHLHSAVNNDAGFMAYKWNSGVARNRFATATSGTLKYVFSSSTADDLIYATQSGATGGGGAHNNMPPYIIVNRWHRTA